MTILVDTNVLLSAAIRDRLPERVIEAIAARDDWTWLATGDKDLLEAQHLVPTRIVTVAEFARLFGIL